MKNYSYLVNRHFKVHKKRGMLTVLGIICAIILFFTIGYLSNYMNDINTQRAKIEVGNYDASVLNIDKASANNIINNIKVEQCGLYKIAGEKEINLANVKKYLSIYQLDDISMNDIFKGKINIIKGKLPKSSEEVVLSSIAKNQMKIDIGDKITIEKNNYEVVGFYDRSFEQDNYSINGFTYLDRNNFKGDINIAIRLKSKNNKYKEIEQIINDSGLDFEIVGNEIEINSDVLDNKKIITYFDGITEINEELIMLWVLNLCVLILTIILTYGSINISINERKKEFATLRCIGATPSKIKGLLIKESVLLGVFSLLPGIIIAQIISWIITNALINKSLGINYVDLNMKIYFNVVFNTILLITINIFCATIIPVIKVGKLSPIDLVKSKDIKNTKIKVRKSKYIRKIFGYTGELAYKNIRANNKNFIITTIALSFILILIVGFSGYKITNDKYYNENIKVLNDISIDFSPNYENIKEDIERFSTGVKNLNVDSKFYTNMNFNVKAIIQGATYNKNINEIEGSKQSILNDKNSIYSSDLNVIVVNDEYINKILPYIENENKKIDKFNENDFVVVNQKTSNSILNTKEIPPILVNEDSTVNLYLGEGDSFNQIESLKPIKMNYLGSIGTRNIINENSFRYFEYLTLIVSNDFYTKYSSLFKEYEFNLFNISMELDKKQNEDMAIKQIEDYVSMNRAHFIKERQEEIEHKKSADVYFNITFIGLAFIVLISGISIINTRNITMHLRKNEFKTLLSIGMKKSKLIKMVFLEGIVACFIASLIGGSISIIILVGINRWYLYISNLDKLKIPFGIVLVGILVILIITTITSAVTYYKFRKLDLNDLIDKEE